MHNFVSHCVMLVTWKKNTLLISHDVSAPTYCGVTCKLCPKSEMLLAKRSWGTKAGQPQQTNPLMSSVQTVASTALQPYPGVVIKKLRSQSLKPVYERANVQVQFYANGLFNGKYNFSLVFTFIVHVPQLITMINTQKNLFLGGRACRWRCVRKKKMWWRWPW